MNRRKNQRKSRRMQVRFWTDTDPRPRAGFTTNLSSSGMFVGTRNPLPVGTEVTVKTLTESPIETRARVARSVKVPPALQMVKQPGMGLHFLEEQVAERILDAARCVAATAGEQIEDGEPPNGEPIEGGEDAADTAVSPEREQRIEELESRLEALTQDHESLRRYADLLEETRTQLTSDIASARGAQTRPPADDSDETFTEAERELDQLRQLHDVQQRAQQDLERQLLDFEQRALNAEGEREALREENRNLSAELESGRVDEPLAGPLAGETASAGQSRTTVWGTLAGVALLGFLVGYLLRPNVEPAPEASGADTQAADAALTAPRSGVASAPRDASPTGAVAAAETPAESDGPALEAAPVAAVDSPPPPVEPNLSTVEATVEAWAAVWSRQDVASYLSHYGADFAPARGASRRAWEAERSRRLQRPASISVEVDALEIKETGLGRAEASFDQIYRADNYSDRVRKTLQLGWEGDAWRILSEVSRPLP